MFSPLVSVILATQVVTAPRSLEVLPNGVSVFVEAMPQTDRVSVQLWVSSRGTEESPETHGHRHLLEHLIAKGLDPTVEANGMFLTAETTRSAVAFKISASPDRVRDALGVLRSASSALRTTQDEIDREIKVMRNEEALLPHSRRMSRWLWHESGRGDHLDPFGDVDSMGSATPEALASLQRKMFIPLNLSLAIVGPVEVRTVGEFARSLFGSLPMTAASIAPPRSESSKGKPIAKVSGAGLGVQVEGLPSRGTLATIGFGLAVNQAMQDVTPVYQPSSRPGMVILATTLPGLKGRLNSLEERQLSPALTLVQQWVRSQGRTPERVASFRGAMMAEGSSLTLQQLEVTARSLAIADILAARDAALPGVSTEAGR